MKWVCLMANMTLPGVGTLICKRWVSGAIQTVGSIIGFTLLGYCIYEFYHALQNYSTSMDGEEEDILSKRRPTPQRTTLTASHARHVTHDTKAKRETRFPGRGLLKATLRQLSTFPLC